MYLKMLSAKWCLICLGLNALKNEAVKWPPDLLLGNSTAQKQSFDTDTIPRCRIDTAKSSGAPFTNMV